MRTVFVPPLGQAYSALGFGCASLGSRVSPGQGQKALALAFERGVTWYDVAPPYGDGAAESLLGAFLTGRRDRVAICTKAGIARSNPRFIARMIRPAARLAVKTFPALRRNIAPLRKNIHSDMPPETIEKSVVESLRALRTDYIDVLALHEPSVALCQDEAHLRMLESFIKKGYVRSVSIAGSLETIAAGCEASNLYRCAQFEDNPFLDAAAHLRRNPKMQNRFFVTHSVFGAGTLARLSNLADSSPAFSSTENLSERLFDYALANNPDGIVLSSMFSSKHIEANCARASAPIEPDAVNRIKHLIPIS